MSIIARLIEAGVAVDLVEEVALLVAERNIFERRMASEAGKKHQSASSIRIPKRAKGALERHGYQGPENPRPKNSQWKKIRSRVMSRDNHTCTYCGTDNAMMVVDHVISLSRGGTNEDSNLATCCFPCNSSKRDLLLSEWGGRSR